MLDTAGVATATATSSTWVSADSATGYTQTPHCDAGDCLQETDMFVVTSGPVSDSKIRTRGIDGNRRMGLHAETSQDRKRNTRKEREQSVRMRERLPLRLTMVKERGIQRQPKRGKRRAMSRTPRGRHEGCSEKHKFDARFWTQCGECLCRRS